MKRINFCEVRTCYLDEVIRRDRPLPTVTANGNAHVPAGSAMTTGGSGGSPQRPNFNTGSFTTTTTTTTTNSKSSSTQPSTTTTNTVFPTRYLFFIGDLIFFFPNLKH
jgi:hypothetical protein